MRKRRQQLELIFWAARQTLVIALLAAYTASTAVALAAGDPTLVDRLLDVLAGR